MVEISVLGISLQETGKPSVLLLHPHASQNILTLDVGPVEALALALSLHEGTQDTVFAPQGNAQAAEALHEETGKAALFPRPLTHDFIMHLLYGLDARLLCVHLTAMVEEACIAEVIVAHAGGRAIIDCRPSDGIALALRCGAPIRASSAVLSRARRMNEVLAGMPEHVRAMAAAKLALLRKDFSHPPVGQTEQGGDPATRIPKAVEAALSAKFAATGKDARRELISVAHKMFEEERSKEKTALAAGLEQLSLALAKAAPRGLGRNEPLAQEQGKAALPGPQGIGERRARFEIPQIRVALVRHTSKGDTELMSEITVSPANTHIPVALLTGLGLSPREAEAVNDASDGDRWAMLLRILAPETKVPM